MRRFSNHIICIAVQVISSLYMLAVIISYLPDCVGFIHNL